MIEKRFTGYRDKTGQPIDEGSRLRVTLGSTKPVVLEGEVKEFNNVWYVVFKPGQHSQLWAVLGDCEVL